jgi:hypothetical protein
MGEYGKNRNDLRLFTSVFHTLELLLTTSANFLIPLLAETCMLCEAKFESE